MTRYPIYVISKGRWEKPYTANSLKKMGMDFSLVVEPSEYSKYAEKIDEKYLLKTPENFSERNQGSIPVRNWVWGHSIEKGFERHWILDDNINGFERLNRNQRGRVHCDGIFRAAEDFVDRFTNVAFAGFEYRQFGGGARRKKPPFKVNYRVYSTTLVNNSIPIRWRGKYNEDTDICLRALKMGWCTITFNAFLQNKMKTMTMKGGNERIYDESENRRIFAESLQEQHPDIVKVVWRYKRWHHEVDYSNFEDNKLIFKENYQPPQETVNNYGMVLVEKTKKEK